MEGEAVCNWGRDVYSSRQARVQKNPGDEYTEEGSIRTGERGA